MRTLPSWNIMLSLGAVWIEYASWRNTQSVVRKLEGSANFLMSILWAKQFRNLCVWSFFQLIWFTSLEEWYWQQSALIANIAQIIIFMNKNMELKMSELERNNSMVGSFLGDTNCYLCVSDWIESCKCFASIATVFGYVPDILSSFLFSFLYWGDWESGSILRWAILKVSTRNITSFLSHFTQRDKNILFAFQWRKELERS